MNILLIKIVLAVLLVGGGAWTVHSHFKHDRENLQALGAANERILNLQADIAGRDQSITELRTSRDTVNTRLAQMIADNNTTIAAEVERRHQVAIERDKAKEALNIALDTIATESNRDESFAVWLAESVPRAAWDRLRAAAE